MLLFLQSCDVSSIEFEVNMSEIENTKEITVHKYIQRPNRIQWKWIEDRL